MYEALVLCGSRGIPLHGPSGASAHLRGIARALGVRWPGVRVAVPLHSDARGIHDAPLGLPATFLAPRRWPGALRERGEVWDNRRLLRRALEEHGQPGMIWERYALHCDAGARLARRRRLARVVELNAPLGLERARYDPVRSPRLARRLERSVLTSALRVVAVSSWLARWAVDEVGCDPGRVVTVPNGVDFRRQGDRAGARGRLGLEGLVVGFVGTMKPWHGTHLLPAILEALPEATALVVGAGPVPPPDHPRLRAVGYVPHDDLPDVIAAMDVGLVPYPPDTPPWFCPLKLFQYRSQGVPVVSSPVGDARRLVVSGGEIVDGIDAAEWAAAIRRQAETPRVPMIRTWGQVVAEALQGL